jgi:hypothetical protein
METPYFFLDSDSPFNFLNDSIKMLLSYIRKFLRNQVGKSNSQMVLSSVNFIRMCYLFYKTFSKMTRLTETHCIHT